jgi:serine/threonine protein kinase
VTWLSDAAVAGLREAAERPDLSGTRYDLVDLVGRGGMGTVFRAVDRELDREVAVKVVDGVVAPDAAARLHQEARILASLEHPGIVPVHDVGVLADGRVFYVMKFVRGAVLGDAVTPATTLVERLRVFTRVCEAVAFAHARGIVHRDLKPSNVMIGPFGEVLVLDWGVARVLPGDAVVPADGAPEPASHSAASGRIAGASPISPAVETTDGAVIGTPGFMAPEQARGGQSTVDERADVYALGLLLDWLVRVGNGGMPAALSAVVTRATAADPGGRYRSVQHLAEEIARFSAGVAVHAHRETVAERIARVFRRHRTPILLVVAYLLMRVLLLLVPR